MFEIAKNFCYGSGDNLKTENPLRTGRFVKLSICICTIMRRMSKVGVGILGTKFLNDLFYSYIEYESCKGNDFHKM